MTKSNLGYKIPEKTEYFSDHLAEAFKPHAEYISSALPCDVSATYAEVLYLGLHLKRRLIWSRHIKKSV